ncbi:hypothetical protein DV736_g5764, partial [Chaetothyriales sp. CBS 134916]
MADRGYQVVYKSRQHTRAPSVSDSTEDQLSPPRHGQRTAANTRSRDVTYGADADYHLSSPKRGLRKTTYEVGMNRNKDAYVKNGNAVLVNTPPCTRAERARKRGNGEPASEWEVIQPRKNREGAYVIDMGAEHASRASPKPSNYICERDRIEIIDVHGDPEVLAPTRTRDRSLSSSTIEAMKQGRTRKTLVDRRPSAFKHDHSPVSTRRRHSRSVGFYKRDVSNHDACERRHEKPGAEAHLAGMYLVGHMGEYVRRDGDDDVTVVAGTSPRQRQRDRHDDDLDTARERAYYPRRRGGQSYQVSEREGAYETQPALRPRHRRDRSRDDDKESRLL